MRDRCIAALKIGLNEDGTESLSVLTQVVLKPDFQICGPGFNHRTVRISIGDAQFYVFREDLDAVR
jgi:hypothetical protein